MDKFKEFTRDHSKKLPGGPPTVYQVSLSQTFSSKDDNIRKFDFGKPVQSKKCDKVLMVVGATGSGKTTVLNGLFNFILGVKWNDQYRFRLVDESSQVEGKTQATSQTSWITSYTIHQIYGSKFPYSLTIIDTPGFGDTQGIKRDKEITEQIRKFFSTVGEIGIDHIDAVGFVVQAALPRLTHTQTYIFDSVLSLFGKDIKDNIFLFLTFADGQKPAALAALELAKIPYRSYFKFNNSAMFVDSGANASDDDDEENFDEMFWKMSNKSYKKFLHSHLDIVEAKSLVLTKTVLEKRSQLETFIEGIQVDIQRGLIKCEEVTRELKVMQEHQKDIESSKDFKYEVKKSTWEKKSSERKAVNCKSCEKTCHYPCGHLMAATCSTINWWFNCVNCGCGIRKHERTDNRYELVTQIITKTKEDMLQKYKTATGRKMTANEMKTKAQEELQAIQEQLVGLTESARKALEELNKIALKPNPLSTTDYIDLMIEAEKQEASPGWQERLEQLTEVRKHAQYMKELADQGFDPFKEYTAALSQDTEDSNIPPEDKKDRVNLRNLFSFRLKFKLD